MGDKIYNSQDINNLLNKGKTFGDILDDDSIKVYTPDRKEVPPERKREFFKAVGLYDVAKIQQNKNGKFMA